MTLKEIQQGFIDNAKNILGEEYELITKADLANGYCDAEEAGDIILRDGYYSAWMLRYWYKIFEWERSSKSLNLDLVDFVGWLHDCLQDALYYRSWRPLRQIEKDPVTKAFIGPYLPNPQYQADDPDAADKSVNYFCKAKRGKEYQANNKDRRRANALTVSLDASVDENGDYALNYAGAYEEPNRHEGIQALVEHFLKEEKSIEALIIDGICNFDSFKTTKTTTTEIYLDDEGMEYEEKQNRYSSSFDARKLVKHLNQIDNAFMEEYFSVEYKLSKEQTLEILNKLNKTNNTKLYKYIEKVLIEIKNDNELLSYII